MVSISFIQSLIQQTILVAAVIAMVSLMPNIPAALYLYSIIRTFLRTLWGIQSLITILILFAVYEILSTSYDFEYPNISLMPTNPIFFYSLLIASILAIHWPIPHPIFRITYICAMYALFSFMHDYIYEEANKMAEESYTKLVIIGTIHVLINFVYAIISILVFTSFYDTLTASLFNVNKASLSIALLHECQKVLPRSILLTMSNVLQSLLYGFNALLIEYYQLRGLIKQLIRRLFVLFLKK